MGRGMGVWTGEGRKASQFERELRRVEKKLTSADDGRSREGESLLRSDDVNDSCERKDERI